MSVEEDVNDIINDGSNSELREEPVSEVPSMQTVSEVLLEVSAFLSATSGSMDIVCARVEEATDRASLRKALRAFNECLAMLKEAMPAMRRVR